MTPRTPTYRPTEAECTTGIIAAALHLGYKVHHCRPARHQSGKWGTPIQGTAGFPDLIIAGHGHVVAAELKRKPNKVEAGQQAWLDALSHGGLVVHVVYVPEGQQSFVDYLSELRFAGPRTFGLTREAKS